MNFMRSFIAINLSDDVKSHLWDFSQNLQKGFKHHKIIWVQKDVFHMTLEFLGDLTEERLEIVKEILRKEIEMIKGREIEIELKEFTAFPSPHNPRTLIIKGRSRSALRINSVQRNFHNALINKGFDLDNKIWHPHITLSRIKDRGVRLNIKKFDLKPVSLKVNSVDLMSSQLTSDGPIYKIIKRYKIQESKKETSNNNQ